MKLVSKEEFYKFIGPLDVILKTEGNYPYTTRFILRYGREVGKIVESFKNGHRGIIFEEYYIKTP